MNNRRIDLGNKIAIIALIVETIVAFAIFFIGDYRSQDSIVSELSKRFELVDQEMSFNDALEAIYKDMESIKRENEVLSSENNRINELITNLTSQSAISEKNTLIIAKAKEYADVNDYQKALSVLNETITKPMKWNY